MNKINYQIKYIEYLLRKCRTKEANLKSPHQFGTQNSAVCGICLLLKQVRSSLCIHALKQAMRV